MKYQPGNVERGASKLWNLQITSLNPFTPPLSLNSQPFPPELCISPKMVQKSTGLINEHLRQKNGELGSSARLKMYLDPYSASSDRSDISLTDNVTL